MISELVVKCRGSHCCCHVASCVRFPRYGKLQFDPPSYRCSLLCGLTHWLFRRRMAIEFWRLVGAVSSCRWPPGCGVAALSGRLVVFYSLSHWAGVHPVPPLRVVCASVRPYLWVYRHCRPRLARLRGPVVVCSGSHGDRRSILCGDLRLGVHCAGLVSTVGGSDRDRGDGSALRGEDCSTAMPSGVSGSVVRSGGGLGLVFRFAVRPVNLAVVGRVRRSRTPSLRRRGSRTLLLPRHRAGGIRADVDWGLSAVGAGHLVDVLSRASGALPGRLRWGPAHTQPFPPGVAGGRPTSSLLSTSSIDSLRLAGRFL